MNGVDIFQNILDALKAYQSKDYFNFGKYVGQAMDEIFHHAPYAKNPEDVRGSDFY